MTVSASMLARIHHRGPGWVFTAGDFLDLGDRAAVDQALSRLARRQGIRRIDRGVYDLPRVHPRAGALWPSADAVARAVAARTGSLVLPTGAAAANALGLSTQVPARAEYLTDGRQRRVRVGQLDVRLGPARRTDLLLPGTTAGTALIALRYLGRHEVTDDVVAQLAARLSESDKQVLLTVRRQVPAWMGGVIGRVAGRGA